jgi:palmitoyl-protein thioesterase
MFYKRAITYLSALVFSNNSFFTGTASLPLPNPTTYTSTSSLITEKHPIVLLHGIASNAENMYPLSDWIETTFQRRVFNIEIGNGVQTSIYSPMGIQLNELCQTIYNNEDLKHGFDFIGISQGGLLARGYVERCNDYPVKTLITLVSPHGGTFIKKLDVDMYSNFYQHHLSVSNYWRDPQDLQKYLTKCSYLPILNNEVMPFFSDENDDKYTDDDADDDIYLLLADKQRNQIKTLENLVLVWSTNDKIVIPPQSGIFSFYNDQYVVIPLEETEIYLSDTLGLKYLNEEGRLNMHQTNCSHEEHVDQTCFAQLYPIFVLYL